MNSALHLDPRLDMTEAKARFAKASVALVEAWDALTRSMGLTPESRAHVRLIQIQTAKVWDLPVGLILAQKRGLAVDTARSVAMYLCRELMPHLCLHEIGAAFCRDHANVIAATRSIGGRIETEQLLRAKVTALRNSLRSLLPASALEFGYVRQQVVDPILARESKVG